MHALILYHIFTKASDPRIKDMSSPLEDIIRRQLVDTLDQQRVSQNDMLQRLRATIDSLPADVSTLVRHSTNSILPSVCSS